MSETFIVFKLKLPKSKTKDVGRILREANSVKTEAVLDHYGQLHRDVAALLRQDSDEWVEDQLTVEEAITPYGCKIRGQQARVEYLSSGSEKMVPFCQVMAECFELAGITIQEIWAYSEDDLDHKTPIDLDADTDRDLNNVGFPVAVLNLKFPSDIAEEAGHALVKSSDYFYYDGIEETELFGLYERIAPGASGLLEALKASNPVWVPKGEQMKNYLHHYQAEVQSDFVSVIWLFPSFELVDAFQKDMTQLLTEVGVEIVPLDTSDLEPVGPDFEVIENK